MPKTKRLCVRWPFRGSEIFLREVVFFRDMKCRVAPIDEDEKYRHPGRIPFTSECDEASELGVMWAPPEELELPPKP